MKLLFIIALSGIVLFFPIQVANSTCLFGLISGTRYQPGSDLSAVMLTHYMRCFALLWWSSIGLSVWSFKTIQKKKQTLNT
jgi:hypothetical protein